MSADPNGILSWDVHEIAKVLKIRPEDVREYFTDGRRVSFIVERRLAREVPLLWVLIYLLIDSHGNKWEVRSITRSGIYFCPSYMVGSGRHFEEEGFLRKLNEIKGFIIADVESFPNIPFWIIPVEQVKKWWDSGKLGSKIR